MTYGSNARIVVPGTAIFRQAAGYFDDLDENDITPKDRIALFDRLTNFNLNYHSGCLQHDLEAFSADWQLLLHADFTTEEMGKILRAVSDAMIQADRNNPDLRNGCRKTILENWATWEINTLKRMPSARAGDIITVYDGCAALYIKPSGRFSGVVHNVVGRTASSLKPPHFSSYLISSAILKDPVPPQIVPKVCAAIGRFATTLDKVGIKIFWASALLHSFTGNEAYKKLAKSIILPHLGDVPISWQKMVYDAHTWFGWDSPVPNPHREDHTKSNTEAMLKAEFAKCGFPVREACFVPEFPQAIDFCSETPDGSLWHECDGPNHFLDNPMGRYFSHVYDGKTLFRAGLIQRVNDVGRILHTPFSIADLVVSKTTSLDAKKSVVEFLASATKYMEPGTTALADLRRDGGHVDVVMMPLVPGKGIGEPFAHLRVR
jgi:hypothetical protein